MEQFMITAVANGISCSADGGNIQYLTIKGKKFNGFPGKVTVSDGLSVTAQWSAEETFLICDLTLTRIAGSFSDGGSIRLRIPYPSDQSKLMIWSAREGFPKTIFEIGGLNLIYGDVCYGTVIPVVSLYNPEAGIGLTVAKAPGRTGGRLSFCFDDYHREGMYVDLTSLEVHPDKPVSFRLLFFGHDACWRPGLRQYADMFKEYFEPVNPAVWSCQSFIMTNPFFRREATAQLRCDWAEIHNHFPYYGNYLPDDAEWESIIGHDYPADTIDRNLKLSRQDIHNHIRDLHNSHIRALYYLQCGGDAFIPWIEKKFPESIAKDSVDHLYPTWMNCCFANGDSETAFGQYLDRQLEQVMEVFPELDGFFVDQLCYQTFDYAHQDGCSATEGRRVYEFGVSLEKKFRKFADMIHHRGKLLLVNGPFDMDIANKSDAIMSEGTGTIFETYRYLCIRKPMLVHEFPESAFKTECMLRSCLLAAAGWSIGGSPSREAPLPVGAEIAELYRKYLPLLKTIFGAEVLLEPNPICWDPVPLAKAEIFRSRENGHVLVSVLQDSGYLHSEVKLHIRNLFRGVVLARVLWLGKSDWDPIVFVKDEEWLVFRLPASYSACVLELIPQATANKDM